MPRGRPTSVPVGLRVRLARARVRPGMEQETDRWMAMLNDRLDEAVETLDRERVALELAFREVDEAGQEWVVWVMIQGEGGASIDNSPFAIDRDHAAFAARCKERRWREADVELLLAPAPVRAALLQAAGLA
jgi:hypothetical protein